LPPPEYYFQSMGMGKPSPDQDKSGFTGAGRPCFLVKGIVGNREKAGGPIMT